MPNEFQFSFSSKDIERIIDEGSEKLIVTGKVVYDDDKKTSTFEIYAEGYQSSKQTKAKGCPMPC